jgi:HEPN domain-containing protein
MGNRHLDWPRQGEADLASADALAHTITPLLGGLTRADAPPEDLITSAKMLDKHSIPTRYPNGLDSGAPADFSTRQEADTACECAGRIVDFCARAIRGA